MVPLPTLSVNCNILEAGMSHVVISVKELSDVDTSTVVWSTANVEFTTAVVFTALQELPHPL